MPIECCDHSNYPLPPRHRHPACEALISNNKLYEHAPPTCLSYVRSTLAVGSKCTFAAPEQVSILLGVTTIFMVDSNNVYSLIV